MHSFMELSFLPIAPFGLERARFVFLAMASSAEPGTAPGGEGPGEGSSMAPGSAAVSRDSAVCPVIEAWTSMKELMTRAASGRIVARGEEINRQTVIDNAEILAPVIESFGALSELGLHACFSHAPFS